jgi:lipooligosaccharide transport system permease protein
MVTLLLPRLIAFEGAGRRSASVVERNVASLQPSYWLVMASGFLEPVLYLFSIGIGVGSLVGDLTLPDGRVIDYAAFVAPARWRRRPSTSSRR